METAFVISRNRGPFAKFAVKSVVGQQKFVVFFAEAMRKPAQMHGIAPFRPKYRCIVFWPKAYDLSQHRTDRAILKFAHSHLPFGFGRL